MIAEVYPFLRLPRRFSVFDYSIPDGLELHTGDVVYVPFRGREVRALVKSLQTTSDAKKLLAVNRISLRSWCNGDDIRRFETIAECIAQSPSSVLHSVASTERDTLDPKWLKEPKSRSVQKTDVEAVTEILEALKDLKDGGSLAVSADKEVGAILAHVIRKKVKGQILILMARERDAELLTSAIAFGDHAVVMHGKTPEHERARITRAWGAGKVQTLIGTRQCALIPAHELALVLVLDAGCDDHLNARRNPRIDSREAAKLQAQQHGAKMIFLDTLPRLEEIASSTFVIDPSSRRDDKPTPAETSEEDEHNIFSPSETSNLEPRTLYLLNLRNPLERTADPLITKTLLEEVKRALQSQKKVLLFLNRKGVAKRLQCIACGHLPKCGTCGNLPTVRIDDLVCERCGTEMWLPKDCPECGKPKIAMRGIGGAKIAESLKSLIPEATVGMVEKGKPVEPNADIVIATEYYFAGVLALFPKKTFGLVVDVASDIGLHGSDFRGTENTMRKIERLNLFAKRQEAVSLIQTWLPDIIEPLLDLKAFIGSELSLRERYHLPPYGSRIVLEKATVDDLPTELKNLFIPRGDALEMRRGVGDGLRPSPTTAALRALPDHIKITYDGPYAKPARPPQPE